MGCDAGNSFIPQEADIPKLAKPNLTYNPFSQIYHVKIKNSKCPHIRVKIFESELEALLDSGAGISILNSLDIVHRYNLVIQPAAIRVTTADGSVHGCLGYVNLPLSYKGLTKVVPTLVVPEISRHLILGADFWESFGIRPMIDLGQGLEEIETVEHRTSSAVCFTIEPSGDLPKVETTEEDDTLDIPVYEGPTEAEAVPKKGLSRTFNRRWGSALQ